MTSIRAKDRGSTTRINESHRNVLACIVVLVVYHKLFLAAIHPTASSQVVDKSSSSSAEERKIEFPTDEDTTYKPFVAIVSCITSNTDRYTHTIDDLLINKLLPSIHTTISHEELDRFHVEILFGYDDTDEYWRETLHQQALLTTNSKKDGRIPISFIPLKKDGDRPYHIPFNELCQKAYDRGVHYLVRINDDTYFLTYDWLTLAVNTLQSFDPPNVGVVGPSCVGDASQEREILTIDMTYLPYHMVIFDSMYYPEVFDNYYIDDWISRVYGVNNRTRRLKEWEMRHDTQAYGTRYRPSFGQDEYLENEVEKGRKRVESFVENLMSSNSNE